MEELTREAFWDLTGPGCSEHYLVHKMRSCAEFVPQLALVAELGGKIVGNIMYTKSLVEDDAGDDMDALTFGPLSVLPEYQGQGVGEALVRYSFAKARDLGYEAVFIFGRPDYYKRFGFRPASEFEIATADGRNFDAFMAHELYPGALKHVSGKLRCAPVYSRLPPEEVEEFDKSFPPRLQIDEIERKNIYE